MEDFTINIAPWSLPREEIPCGITFSPSINLTSIDITLEDNMEVKEVFYADNYSVSRHPKGVSIYMQRG